MGEASNAILAQRKYETCGTCQHTGINPHHMDMVECFGVPPIPTVVGMAQGLSGPEPYIQPLRPMLPRGGRACSLHVRAKAILEMN